MTAARAVAGGGAGCRAPAACGHLPFGYLSTGQRRRAAIARLLVVLRPLWLLDEPTSGLDKARRRCLLIWRRKHLQAGGMLVAATHLPLGLDGLQHLVIGGEA